MITEQTLLPKQVFVVQSDDQFEWNNEIETVVDKFRSQHPDIPINYIHFRQDTYNKYHKRFYIAYSMSTSKYVSIWDDDLIVGKLWLQTVVEFIQQHNDMAIVGNNEPRILQTIPDPYTNGGNVKYYKENMLLKQIKQQQQQQKQTKTDLQQEERITRTSTTQMKNGTTIIANQVDWPIQQYNLRREYLRYFFAEPVYTYETGEDMQLAYALQKHGIKSYAIVNDTNKGIYSRATDSMGSNVTRASWKRDQSPRYWLICHLLKLGFHPIHCQNCVPTTIQRCLEHFETTKTPTYFDTTMYESSKVTIPTFVLTMPTRLQRAKQATQHLTNVHFVPGMDRTKMNIEDLVAEKILDWNTIPIHQAKYPIKLGQIAVHLGHIRMLYEYRKVLHLFDYAIFLEDDIEVLSKDFERQIEHINATAPEKLAYHQFITLSCNMLPSKCNGGK